MNFIHCTEIILNAANAIKVFILLKTAVKAVKLINYSFIVVLHLSAEDKTQQHFSARQEKLTRNFWLDSNGLDSSCVLVQVSRL